MSGRDDPLNRKLENHSGSASAAGQTCLAAAPPSLASATPVAGLSKPHIVTDGYPNRKITFHPGCMLLEVQGRAMMIYEGDPRKRGKRAKIKEWSSGSRMRFRCDMARILKAEWSKATLITLTYPAEAPFADDFGIYKDHLRVFMQALERRFAGCSGYWKLEFQKRGAPHYHLICFGLHDHELQTLIEWVTKRWYDIAHNGDKHLGVAGTKVERVRSGEGAMGYAAKYVAKTESTLPGNFTGRYWGRFKTAAIPYGSPREVPLTDHQANQVARLTRRLMEKQAEDRKWKAFLSPMNPNHSYSWGTRMEWDRLRSAHHGGAKSIQMLQINSSRETGLETYTQRTAAIVAHKPPGKWKARRNSCVRFIGDVDRIMQLFLIGAERGLFPAKPDASNRAGKNPKTPAWLRENANRSKTGSAASRAP